MKIFIIVIIVIIVLFVAVCAFYGGFTNLKCKIEKKGGETVVYKNVIGDYRQTGVVMDEIYYKLLNDFQIETYKGYGKYFDNPTKVEKNKLRSEAGNIIEEKDLDKLNELPQDYLLKKMAEEKFITTEFPYKGKISVIFGIMKVYSAINKFAEKNGFSDQGAVIEIYDIPNKKIIYRKEIKEK
ncbi:MAG: hypothetical protein JXB17_06190 [Bacteroidales bacterium]|nr:hypothetical protein [Bacteroidales bacterium]